MTNTEHKSNTPTEIRDLWQTPEFVFDYYNRRFDFEIDMAASSGNRHCTQYITEQENALLPDTFLDKLFNLHKGFNDDGTIKGSTSVFCNPPYSDLKPWVTTAIEYSKTYGVKIVMLIPADTSVQWFKLAYENCSECHFISGRLSFINADTQKPASGNNKGSVVFVFDSRSPVRQSVHLINRDDMK